MDNEKSDAEKKMGNCECSSDKEEQKPSAKENENRPLNKPQEDQDEGQKELQEEKIKGGL